MFDIEKIIFVAIKAGAVITIREDSVTIVPVEPENAQEEPKPAPKKEPDPKKQGARKKLDMGKVTALRNAGWSREAIAEEMGVSKQTIANRLKEVEA